jgi:nitrogen PTS system EIIA component
MNMIVQLLTPESILTELEAGSKKRLFEQVSAHFEKLAGIARNDVFTGLINRERLGSTALGLGVAIPHARLKGLKQATGVFVRLKTAIDFDAPDDHPVQLVFVLMVPEDANEAHLEALSNLAEMFSRRSFREQLQLAPDAARLFEVFASASH